MGYTKEKQKPAYKRNKTSGGLLKEKLDDVLSYPIVAVPRASITKRVAQYLGIRSRLSSSDGTTVVATYFPSRDKYGKITGFKKRDWSIPKEEDFHFTTVGSVKAANQMFGQYQAAKGINKKQINILEGEGDLCAAMESFLLAMEAMSRASNSNVANYAKSVLKGFDEISKGNEIAGLPTIPLISLNCGCGSATDSVAANERFINSYGKKVIAFDNDEASAKEKEKNIIKGKEATDSVASFLLSDQTFTFKYPNPINDPDGFKDIRDMFEAGLHKDIYEGFSKCSNKYVPDKLISLSDVTVDDLRRKKKDGIYLPELPKLYDKTRGPRKGELWTLTGPSGAGKSTITKKIEYSIIQYLRGVGDRLDDYKEDERCGIIHLEEDEDETINSLYAEDLRVDPKEFAGDPESFISVEEHARIHNQWIKEDKVKVFDHFGSIPIQDLMSKLKQMVFLDRCEWLVLDHLSMVVSGIQTNDERKMLDIVMTELAAFCKQYNVFILVVSHIKRVDVQTPKDEEATFWHPVRKEQLRGCLNAESEFLTPNGWKAIGSYVEGDMVLQYNKDGSTEFVKPDDYVVKECGEFNHMTSESLDMVLSDEHRIVYEDSQGRLNTILASDLVDLNNTSEGGLDGVIPTTFNLNSNHPIPLTDAEIKVQLTINNRNCNLDEVTGQCYFYSLNTELNRLTKLLDDAFIEHSIEPLGDYSKVSFKAPLKHRGVGNDWYSIPKRQLNVIKKEWPKWATKLDKDSNCFVFLDKADADYMQFVWNATGSSAVIREESGGYEGIVYVVDLDQQKPAEINNNPEEGLSMTRKTSTDGFKYCFGVQSGMFVARHNGHIFITGNSASLEQLSWVVLAVEPEELPQRERGRCRVVSLKNRPHKKLGVADTFHLLSDGSLADASDWDYVSGRFVDSNGADALLVAETAISTREPKIKDNKEMF